MDTDAAASYTKLKGFPNLFQAAPNSQLWQHGAHSGPALSEAAEGAVISWLETEFPGQPIDDGPTGGAARRAARSRSKSSRTSSPCA
jgi:hypothetical protein